MDWFTQTKDLIGIVIATLAVVLKLVTVLVQKRKQQRDAYRQIYDVLMSPDLHRGRWTLVDIGNGKIEIPRAGLTGLLPYLPHPRRIRRAGDLHGTGSSPVAWSSRFGGDPCWTCARVPRSSVAATPTGSRGRTCGGCSSACSGHRVATGWTVGRRAEPIISAAQQRQPHGCRAAQP